MPRQPGRIAKDANDYCYTLGVSTKAKAKLIECERERERETYTVRERAEE